MRYRLLLLLSVVVACVSLSLTGVHLKFRYLTPAAPHSHLPYSSAGYLGVYEPGVPPSYAPIETFAQTIRRQPNLVGYYSGWAEKFPSSFAQKLHSHHQIPYIQIDPTYATVSQIADGTYDAYLQTYADSVRDFGHAVVIGFGHEMNGPWYSWGYGRVKATTFVAAWRHIVTLFRADGAQNVTWLWTINADVPGTGRIAAWWPGKAYVTWVGIDGYYTDPKDTFYTVFGRTIKQVRKVTQDPILLSETAVAPEADRSAGILNLFHGAAKYKTLGLVWFDMQSDQGVLNQDWRIEGNQPAENSFSFSVAHLNLVNPTK
jgi:mannan endo-1,4-beta-mannosidase